LRLKVSPATAAMLACWEGSCLAAGCCGSPLAPPRWSATCRGEGYWEGALGANLVVPPLLLAWVGAEGAGVDRGEIKEHGDSAGASQHSAALVKFISFGFASASARRNARKNSNLNFQNFPLWVLIKLDKVPSHIFVTVKGGVLQKFIFQI
jgi:hypothetical protein